jgi:hypothetical protein
MFLHLGNVFAYARIENCRRKNYHATHSRNGRAGVVAEDPLNRNSPVRSRSESNEIVRLYTRL